MKKSIVMAFILSLTCFFVISQEKLKVTKKDFPFKKVVEWPKRGTLLIGDDPAGKTKEMKLSLLNHKGEVAWDRSIYPTTKNSRLIMSGMADYIYFIDNFKPIRKYIFYNQVNISGSVVSSKLDMLNVIRDYGYRVPQELVLQDIISTPKALVLYFQLPVKSKDIIENFFVTITHHNNRVYYCKGPSSGREALQEGEEDPFVFAGASESSISFSRYKPGISKDGIEFFEFTPKAKPLIGRTYHIKDAAYVPSKIRVISHNASNYLERERKEDRIARGKGVMVKSHYYYIYNDSKDKCLKIYKREKDGKLTLVNTCDNKAEKTKNAAITLIRIGEKLLVIGKMGKISSSFIVDGYTVQPVHYNSLNIERLQNNPSAFLVREKTDNFVHFVQKKPYYMVPWHQKRVNEVIFKQIK